MSCRKIFLTPGPGALFPELATYVEEALEEQIPSLSHRSSQFEELYRFAAQGIRELLSAQGHHVFFVASATEAMERVVSNLVAKNSFHFVNGAFSRRFFQVAQELGKEARAAEAPLGEGFALDSFEIPQEVELVCVTHNETSTGVVQPGGELATLKGRFPHALLAVDVVSSAPQCELDFGALDAAFFSVQKLFGMPAGLGVLLVNDTCLERAQTLLKKGISIGSYHSFPSLFEFASKFQTPETPNVLAIFLLGRVCQALLKKGLQNVRALISERAARLYSFLDAGGPLSAFVRAERYRSPTVVSVEVQSGSKPLHTYLERHGIMVGEGYGKHKHSQVRIANFPALTEHEFESALSLLKSYQLTV